MDIKTKIKKKNYCIKYCQVCMSEQICRTFACCKLSYWLHVDTSVEGIALTVALFPPGSLTPCCLFQDALLDMVRRSRIHFVHCILPKADALKALSGSLFKGGECEAQGDSADPGLMQLDVALLRAQLRGSKLLDALRIYRQGEVAAPVTY